MITRFRTLVTKLALTDLQQGTSHFSPLTVSWIIELEDGESR